MKAFAPLLLACFIPFSYKNATSTEVLQSMYARYHGHWHKTLSFNQTTERYKNNTLIKTSTWYERIVYPDKLRIDFDSLKSGSGVIFRSDSTYVFRNNKIAQAVKGGNDLIFFLGGMYALPFDSIVAHFAQLNYNLSKFHASTWKGKPVYVLGADKDGDKANQLWIDQERLIPVRFIEYKDGRKEEGYFEQHIALKDAWSETKCSFYFDDKLLQVETYHNVTADVPVDIKVFDPSSFQH